MVCAEHFGSSNLIIADLRSEIERLHAELKAEKLAHIKTFAKVQRMAAGLPDTREVGQ